MSTETQKYDVALTLTNGDRVTLVLDPDALDGFAATISRGGVLAIQTAGLAGTTYVNGTHVVRMTSTPALAVAAGV